MSLTAWESLSAEDREIFRDAARESSQFMREHVDGAGGAIAASRPKRPATPSSTDFDRKPFEEAMSGDLRQRSDGSGLAPIDRAYSPGSVNSALARHSSRTSSRHGRAPAAAEPRPGDRRASSAALPIRWRILSIAALNAAVVRRPRRADLERRQGAEPAWDDVRKVRESDKMLALLESEASRLQNLIHRYINQPSPELFAEILLLARGGARHADATAAPTDPMLSGSVDELRARHRALPQRLRRAARACRPRSRRPTRTGARARPRRWPGSMPSSRAPSASARR